MKNDRLALWLFGFAIFGAIGLAIGNDLTKGLCEGVKLEDLNDGKAVFGCREFWFNRYQTTVQTIISSMIGAIGIFFVVQQLIELGRQNDITRSALEANLEADRATRRMFIGKALVAINKFDDAVAHLSHHGLTLIGVDSNELYNHAVVAKADEAISDIYPALYTKGSQEEWKKFQRELKVVSLYVKQRLEGYEPDEAKQIFLDAQEAPVDDNDAAQRALGLTVTVIQLRHSIDFAA